MSNRERWIVYPLLFFSIALSAKTVWNQSGRLDANQIVCRSLQLVDNLGAARLQLVADRQGGVLAILDSQGQQAVVLESASSGGGQVQVAGPSQVAAVVLDGSAAGGQIRVAGHSADPVILLGFPDQEPVAGLMALNDTQPVTTPPLHAGQWGVLLPRTPPSE